MFPGITRLEKKKGLKRFPGIMGPERGKQMWKMFHGIIGPEEEKNVENSKRQKIKCQKSILNKNVEKAHRWVLQG